MRRSALTILAALFLSLVPLHAQSHARGIPEPVIYTGAGGGDFPYKPAKLKYSKAETRAGIAVVLKGIDWSEWGGRAATGRGTIHGCPAGGDCFTSDVVLKARKLVSLDTIGYYTRLGLTFGQQRFGFRLPIP
jgi:hypothetical protein